MTLSSSPSQPLPEAGAVLNFSDGFDGMPVLIIDDEPTVRESMQALMQRWDCKVLTAGSKAEALEVLAVSGSIPEIVLADYHLDQQSTGCDAIQSLRQHFAREIPAAILTADHSDETRALLRAQHLPILNKPVKPNRLRALMIGLLAAASC